MDRPGDFPIFSPEMCGDFGARTGSAKYGEHFVAAEVRIGEHCVSTVPEAVCKQVKFAQNWSIFTMRQFILVPRRFVRIWNNCRRCGVYHRSMPRMVKIARWTGLALVILVALLFITVQTQQRILRWRAERLLADIRAIQMGKSTWADAQRLMNEWGAWGEWQGKCSAKYCDYEISMDDYSRAFHHYPVLHGGQFGSHLRWPQWLNGPYTWLGGRFVVVNASFGVRNGFIRSKEFGVRMALGPDSKWKSDPEFVKPNSTINAEMACEGGLFHKDGTFSLTDPEFTFFVVDNDVDGHWTRVLFTPFASNKTVNDLMVFNLSCITRRHKCGTSAELMPIAGSTIKHLRQNPSNEAKKQKMTDLPLWIASRDADHVAIATALLPTANRSLHADGYAAFRITKVLGGSHWTSNMGPYAVKTLGAVEFCRADPKLFTTLQTGSTVILLFNDPLNESTTPLSESSDCELVPKNNENTAEVMRGIQRAQFLWDRIDGDY